MRHCREIRDAGQDETLVQESGWGPLQPLPMSHDRQALADILMSHNRQNVLLLNRTVSCSLFRVRVDSPDPLGSSKPPNAVATGNIFGTNETKSQPAVVSETALDQGMSDLGQSCL